MKKPDTTPLKIGDRVRVSGYHKNYTPSIIEIHGEVALVAVREMPDPEPKWVKITKLEKV